MFKLNKFVVLILVLFLYSCSSNNMDEVALEEGEEAAVEVEAEAEVEAPVVEQPTETPIVENTRMPEENIDPNAINYSIVSSKYKVSKRAAKLINDHLQEIVSISRDNSFAIAAQENNQNNEEQVEPTEEEAPTNMVRPAPVIINNIESTIDTVSYMKSFLPQYTVIARSRFSSKRDINASDIRGFGAYIDSTLVAYKGFYEPSLGKYIYDIVFMTGDIYAETSFWYRNSSESTPLAATLERLRITDLNNLINVIPEDAMVTAEDTANNQETNEAVAENTNQDSNVPQAQAQAQNPLDLSKFDNVVLQKNLVSFRVNTVIGLWQDMHSGEIYEIRELPNNDKSLSTKNKTYGAYVILDAEPRPLKINKDLNWINEDLKFEFQISTQKATYINNEKMPTKAFVRHYPAKGLMMVFLTNKEVRYLTPIVPDLPQFIYKELYGDLRNMKPEVANITAKDGTPALYAKTLPATSSSSTAFLLWTIPIGLIVFTIIFL